MLTETPPIRFPQAVPPEPGQAVQVAPGVLWVRFWLPFTLNHVNVYLIEDGDGWVAFDTGLGIDDTKAAWDAILAGPLGGSRLTRLVCSHYHPDHVGMVGWLIERLAIPLYMPRTEFLTSLSLQHRAFAANRPFYAERGLPADSLDRVTNTGLGYLRLVTGLPTQFTSLTAGENLRLGGRDFTILTGGGHSPEQAMLYCAADNILLAADQVMTRISPNISVQAMEPEDDPLGDYLGSLAALRGAIPPDVLVLPGHHMPFEGLHARIDELAAHHAERCALVAAACRAESRTAAELLPTVFKRQLDPHQMGFAFSEVVAHVNYMLGRGELTQFRGDDGVLRVLAA